MRRPIAWISGFVALASFLVARPAFSECHGSHCRDHRSRSRAPASVSVYGDPQLLDAITIASQDDLISTKTPRAVLLSRHKRRITVHASSLWEKTPYSPQYFVKSE